MAEKSHMITYVPYKAATTGYIFNMINSNTLRMNRHIIEPAARSCKKMFLVYWYLTGNKTALINTLSGKTSVIIKNGIGAMPIVDANSMIDNVTTGIQFIDARISESKWPQYKYPPNTSNPIVQPDSDIVSNIRLPITSTAIKLHAVPKTWTKPITIVDLFASQSEPDSFKIVAP